MTYIQYITKFSRKKTIYTNYTATISINYTTSCLGKKQPESQEATAQSHTVPGLGMTETTYRVSQEEWTKLRESVPYVKIYRYYPKHLYPKLNGYGDNGQRSFKV